MLRLTSLARAVSLTPLRLGRKTTAATIGQTASFSRQRRRGGAAVPPADNDDADDDDDDDDDYLEEDWGDDGDDDDDDDDFDFDDDDLDDWMGEETMGGLPGKLKRGASGVEEHVKQKVSVRRAKHSKRRFVDRIRIKATGGHGGNGCSSFFSESAMRKRPNGGHGGAGGNVIITADSRIQNLANATHHFKGGSGQNGMRTLSDERGSDARKERVTD
ncbi:hypothetical protein PINS_up000126 [Pythium insidiosum]|nr:hypothetical protein PINS_up000126 [Pythium insidiosum]